ncbi:MAG: response regulator [Acidimicrobiales bacterium]
MTLRILLADDHAILREGIRRSFESAGEIIVGEAANGQQALTLALSTRPDIIVMDLSMPVLDGIDATRAIKQQLPEAKIVVLTMHDDVDATRRALEAGAAGFMSKGSSFAEVLATVRGVASGEIGFSPELAAAMLAVAREQPGVDPQRFDAPAALTPRDVPDVIDLNAERAPGSLLSERQVEILQAIADGATTKQVARQLNITQKTVHNHLNAIYRRLDTQSLTHAVLSAVRLGIIELE